MTVFKPDYPQTIHFLGDLIRKTRMDLNLQIKDLAKLLKVEEDTIINWEYRRMQPTLPCLKSIVEFLKPHINGSMLENDFWQLCFKNNKFYPQQLNTFGEKLRATRMKNFLSIPQVAKEFNVDPTSINRWELGKSDPLPKLKDMILAWIKSDENNISTTFKTFHKNTKK
ncbi:helix-turn-helix domain-containing protein [Desulfotignum phosphitoxidans]|nr:helix-turn-helix transcriptional regulator [Desulfotignum phosphitoxidans]